MFESSETAALGGSNGLSANSRRLGAFRRAAASVVLAGMVVFGAAAPAAATVTKSGGSATTTITCNYFYGMQMNMNFKPQTGHSSQWFTYHFYVQQLSWNSLGQKVYGAGSWTNWSSSFKVPTSFGSTYNNFHGTFRVYMEYSWYNDYTRTWSTGGEWIDTFLNTQSGGGSWGSGVGAFQRDYCLVM